MPSRTDLSGASLFPPQEGPSSASSPSSSSQNGWISAHCDGGARGNPGPAGYGALIQSADGAVIAELSEFLGLRTNNFAEYSGLLGCLDFALKNGYRKLRVVSDSELMVKQIQGKYQVKSPDLKPLYDEAKRRIAQLDGFEISHALRHKQARRRTCPHCPDRAAPSSSTTGRSADSNRDTRAPRSRTHGRRGPHA